MKTEKGIVIERNIACGGKPWVDRRGGRGARSATRGTVRAVPGRLSALSVP